MARFGFVCNEDGFAHLREIAPEPERIEKVYHGLDLARFPPPKEPRAARRGESPEDAVRIVSVGRLVEKKGYDDLLRALADLPDTLHWRFLHLGGGPLHGPLSAQAKRLGVADRIEWRGPGTQADVLALLREGDIFCLPAKVAKDGDRDGLPNVLLEAASQELPILATYAGATQDFVVQNETGMLAHPGRPAMLAEALTQLIERPSERRRLGVAARRRLEREFRMEDGAERIAERLTEALAAAR
jgi:glycosyltransferase involved in cell wall biosynthesis